LVVTKLKVVTAVEYLTNWDGQIADENHYRTNKMVKILKGREINGTLPIKIAGVRRHLDNSSAADFLPIAHDYYARAARSLVGNGPATIVPVPGSQVTASDDPDFRTLALAEGAARISAGTFRASPAIVFETPQLKSAGGGGSRDPSYLQSVMKITVAPDGPIVLLDDVKTTGAHLVAAARTLRAAGCDVVGAIAFARTAWAQGKPIASLVEELELDPPAPANLDEWFS